MEMLTEYLAKGFMTMLSISMPCVLTAAAIGLVVGIIQAVTQVQEQTIYKIKHRSSIPMFEFLGPGETRTKRGQNITLHKSHLITM